VRKLISVDEAKGILDAIEVNASKKVVPLFEAFGKYAAEDVFAPMDLPPFSRSTRDGYAVISEDVTLASEKSPVKLKIVGKIEAGENKRISLNKGECVKVSTGAIVPSNCDAVVMVENTEESGEFVFVKKAVAPKENVMAKGSDVSEGDLIVKKGERITPEKIALLSGLGFSEVAIVDVKTAVFSTGNEIVLPGQKLEFGKIYDVNGAVLTAHLRNYGFSAEFLGILKDDVEVMSESILKAAEKYSVIITSGATSAGEKDLLVEAVKEVGEILFHGVSVKPGKPFLVAKINDATLFGLPGFPASALTIFHEFVLPVLVKSVGGKLERRTVDGVVAKRIYSEGRRELLPVVVAGGRIFPIEKGSGAVTSMANASGYMEIHDNEEIIERGEKRRVYVFSKTHDYAFAGLDILKLLPLDHYFLTENVSLAVAEFSAGNVDAALTPGDEYDVNVVFSGESGKVCAVSGYGVEADLYVKDHYQLIYLLKSGKVTGAYFVEPFARRFKVSGELVGKVSVSLLTKDETIRAEFEKLLEPSQHEHNR